MLQPTPIGLGAAEYGIEEAERRRAAAERLAVERLGLRIAVQRVARQRRRAGVQSAAAAEGGSQLLPARARGPDDRCAEVVAEVARTHPAGRREELRCGEPAVGRGAVEVGRNEHPVGVESARPCVDAVAGRPDDALVRAVQRRARADVVGAAFGEVDLAVRVRRERRVGRTRRKRREGIGRARRSRLAGVRLGRALDRDGRPSSVRRSSSAGRRRVTVRWPCRRPRHAPRSRARERAGRRAIRERAGASRWILPSAGLRSVRRRSMDDGGRDLRDLQARRRMSDRPRSGRPLSVYARAAGRSRVAASSTAARASAGSSTAASPASWSTRRTSHDSPL